jgi:hypothetical protein
MRVLYRILGVIVKLQIAEQDSADSYSKCNGVGPETLSVGAIRRAPVDHARRRPVKGRKRANTSALDGPSEHDRGKSDGRDDGKRSLPPFLLVSSEQEDDTGATSVN